MPDYKDMPLSRIEYENQFGHGAHQEENHENGTSHEDHHNEAPDEDHANGTHNT